MWGEKGRLQFNSQSLLSLWLRRACAERRGRYFSTKVQGGWLLLLLLLLWLACVFPRAEEGPAVCTKWREEMR